jgi:ribosome-binding protein aMBF1 (putative translation factor)
MICADCGREINGAYVLIRVDGKYVPAHRDCGMCVTYHGPQPKKKPRCRVTKALRKYRKEHEDGR